MKLIGSTWELVGGESFSTDGVRYLSVFIDNNNIPHVAFEDADNGQKLTVAKYE